VTGRASSPAQLLAVELDAEARWDQAVPVAVAAGADGVVLTDAGLPSTRVPDVDAVSFALPLPVPAISASVGAGTGRLDLDRLVGLMRTAQRLGGDGARLLLAGGTASDTEAADLVVLLRSLVDLSAAFGVVLALDASGCASSSRAVSCALRVPGVTVVGSSTDLGSPFDGVLSRPGAGDRSGIGRAAGWQIRRQSELMPAGA
jgi:hypothetical protein